MSSATWWFVRHAESTANAEGWLAGHTDAPLTPRGRSQAEALAGELQARGLRPGRVWASDLERAWRTAELAWPSGEPPLARFAALRERNVGEWEALRRRGLPPGAANRLLTWHGVPPGGESQAMLARRVLRFLAAQPEGPDTLVFVHGGLIRCVIGLLDGTPTDQIGTWKVKNGEIAERKVAPGAWQALIDRHVPSASLPG